MHPGDNARCGQAVHSKQIPAPVLQPTAQPSQGNQAGDERHRSATHPERGTMTLWTIAETMAGHDINHLQQLERLTRKPG